jgi:antitoxin component of MazEF toxin-antitoxin module
MVIKAKIRHIGNSLGVILPREVITNLKAGDDIELDVITKAVEKDENVITLPLKDVLPGRMEMCNKHLGSRKATCGCK